MQPKKKHQFAPEISFLLLVRENNSKTPSTKLLFLRFKYLPTNM